MTPEFRVRLSKEQEELLRSLEKDIEIAKQELERAKKLGVDVSDLEQRLREADQIRKELLEKFGSGS